MCVGVCVSGEEMGGRWARAHAHLAIKAKSEIREVAGKCKCPRAAQRWYGPVLVRVETEQGLAAVDDEMAHR